MLSSADAYRGLFTFGVFNAIQSTCFDDVSLFVASAIPHFFLTRHEVDAHPPKYGKPGFHRRLRR
jgi:hypothetical protein